MINLRRIFFKKSLSDMDIYEIAASHRSRFLAGESKAVARIASSYVEAEAGIKKSLAEVEAKIAAYYAAGNPPGEIAVSWLNSQDRYHALLTQIEAEMTKFSDKAKAVTEAQQSDGLKVGAGDVAENAKAQMKALGISGTFHGLHSRAFEEMIGTLSNGSPLYRLFKDIAPNAVAGARGVFGQAMAEGWNPRKTAAKLTETMEISKGRATLIARTESIRSYRLASQRQMLLNQDVLDGWVWYASPTLFTCPVCLAMDGSKHKLGDIMNSHPNCRCVMVPLVKSLASIANGTDQGAADAGSLAELPYRQPGDEWFAGQDPAHQLKTLGRGKFDLYSAGKIDLQDLVQDTYDDQWGKGKKERSLKSLLEMVDAGTTHVELGLKLKAEAQVQKEAQLLAGALKVAEKLAKIEAKAAYEKAKAEAEAKLAKEAEEKLAKEKQIAANDKVVLAGIQSGIDLSLAEGDYYPPSQVHGWHTNGMETTVTVADVEALYKKNKLYSPEEKAVYAARMKAKADAEAEAKAAAAIEEHKAKVKSDTEGAAAHLVTSGAHLVENDIHVDPTSMLHALDYKFPNHTLSVTDVEKAWAVAGIVDPVVKAAKAAEKLKEKQHWDTVAAESKVIKAAKELGGSLDNFDPQIMLQGVKGYFPDAQLTVEKVADLWAAHAPPKPSQITNDLGYPGEHLLKGGSEFPSKDAYVAHLVKEVGGEWTTEQLLAKIKAEYPNEKAGWNSKGIAAAVKKAGVGGSQDAPTPKAAAPRVAPNLPPGPLKVEAWKLDPESIVLGGKPYTSKKGSNPGEFYTGTDGEKYYVKFYTDAAQALNEHLANSVYRDLGITAADTTVFVDSKGRTTYVSKIIENEGTLGEHFPKAIADKILDGFAADVLLSNWDVVGLNYDNIVKLGSGDVARIDNGGSLLYRATNGRKPASVLNGISEWDVFATGSSKYQKVLHSANIHNANELGERAIKQIDAIEAMQKRVGGWRKYVDESVPSLPQADRDTIVKMLTSRTALLAEKRTEIKAEVAEANRPPAARTKPLKTTTFGRKQTEEINDLFRKGGHSLQASIGPGYTPAKESIWLKDAWRDHVGIYTRLVAHVVSWTNSSRGHIFHEAARGEGSAAADVKIALATRAERWDNLAKRLGLSSAPKEFHVFRGMRGKETLDWVAVAWQDETAPFMRANTSETASWSTHVTAANKFYGTDIGVKYEARIPIENTFFDKWLDDSTFISSFAGENEVIAGGSKPNAIAVRKQDVKVRLDGKEYSYDEREAFFAHYKRKHGMLPTVSSITDAELISLPTLAHGVTK